LALIAVCVGAPVLGWAAVPALLGPVSVIPLMICGGLTYRNWPTGIRITDEEIRIGAVRSRRAARRSRQLTVTHQSWGLFRGPLVAVRTMTVVTDPGEIRRIKRSPDFYTLGNRWSKPRAMRACKIGVLTPPFMRAALVVELDSGSAHFPAVKQVAFHSRTRGTTHLVPQESTVWVVPTRHPERLRAVVRQLGKGAKDADARRYG
jgi:hypothetical protein